MRSIVLASLVLPGALMLGGCLAKAAVGVVTAPVKIASGAVDMATTSQSEADEKRGRELRQREEELGRLERRYAEQMRDCTDGSRRACDEARATYAEMQVLLPTIPAASEPR